MKASELIEKLQKCDPDEEIYYQRPNGTVQSEFYVIEIGDPKLSDVNYSWRRRLWVITP